MDYIPKKKACMLEEHHFSSKYVVAHPQKLGVVAYDKGFDICIGEMKSQVPLVTLITQDQRLQDLL